MGTFETFVTATITAVVVIGGVIYSIKRKGPRVNDPNIIKQNNLSTQDILSWIDDIMTKIIIKKGCNYYVNIIPNSSTIKLLNKPVKNAFAVILLEKDGDKVAYLRQTIFIVNSLSEDLSSLKEDKIVEIPIKL